MKKKFAIHPWKRALEKRRDALRHSLTNEIASLRSETGIDIGDAAEIAIDDAFDLVSSQLAESESKELAKIELALERIRRGTFGICSGCEGEIPTARLEVLPYATRCVKCERNSERIRLEDGARSRWSNGSDEVDDGDVNNPFAGHVADVY